MAQVIVQQPLPGGAAPFAPAMDTPHGLHHLIHADYLRIKQKIEWCEVCSGCETRNWYKISNPQGQVLYDAKESSCCCIRRCCEANRGFKMRITDQTKKEVLVFQRKCQCQLCCFPTCCCLQRLHIYTSTGEKLGTIVQQCSCWRPLYDVEDASGNTVLEIQGPCRTCSCPFCCRSVGFDILQGGNQVGMIRKEYSGIAKEVLTDADNFYVTFPRELDVKIKSCLLGAVFLIDFMFFESHTEELD